MKLLPYARLLRLPNVFSSFADIAVGFLIALFTLPVDSELIIRGFLLLVCSGCLYTAGMVFNDLFDLEIDRKERPFRPLPSGKISKSVAWSIAMGLTLAGLIFAALADQKFSLGGPFSIACVLVAAILLYDGVLKYTLIGPVSMAACRFLNMYLGLTLAQFPNHEIPLALSATTSLYILGVTFFAKQEATTSNRGILALGAAIILAAGLGSLSIEYLKQETLGESIYPILLAVFLLGIGRPLLQALREPTPQAVQKAVKRCIFGLIVFDAILATIFVGVWGLAIALLLIPAFILGKWVYST
ncbi:UbiA family prenyltransferase [Telmatocola sphagniphila]|uniref:UbiA family prenyltransferase n=1 Tax=Telmatocola sphagniphila TaxID=1123043 RepID=A0A8E6BAV8_9BACT|nr:UbiA family prenyltransferase [Telmatocola sphagniphila]QVL34649.1 UbiA family prenyltransferase [Telmatocola sphagniphila]